MLSSTGRGLHRVARAGPQIAVESLRELVEAGTAGGEDPWGGIALAGREADLAGQQQLAGTQQPVPVVQPLRVHQVVARPTGMDSPHPAGGEAESRRSGDQHERGVQAGLALTGFAPVGADVEAAALRDPFEGVPTGQIQQFVGTGGHREGERHAFQVVRTVGVGHS